VLSLGYSEMTGLSRAASWPGMTLVDGLPCLLLEASCAPFGRRKSQLLSCSQTMSALVAVGAVVASLSL
jgi:hypothetical protein